MTFNHEYMLQKVSVGEIEAPRFSTKLTPIWLVKVASNALPSLSNVGVAALSVSELQKAILNSQMVSDLSEIFVRHDIIHRCFLLLYSCWFPLEWH